MIQVVRWFVEKGCKDMELCLALTAAASSSRLEVAAFLLSHVPHHVLQTLSAEILKVLFLDSFTPVLTHIILIL